MLLTLPFKWWCFVPHGLFLALFFYFKIYGLKLYFTFCTEVLGPLYRLCPGECLACFNLVPILVTPLLWPLRCPDPKFHALSPSTCYGLNCVFSKGTWKSQSPVPRRVILFGNRGFADVLRLRWCRSGEEQDSVWTMGAGRRQVRTEEDVGGLHPQAKEGWALPTNPKLQEVGVRGLSPTGSEGACRCNSGLQLPAPRAEEGSPELCHRTFCYFQPPLLQP